MNAQVLPLRCAEPLLAQWACHALLVQRDRYRYHPAMIPIKSDPEVMHGAACFGGTRVPVASLFDHFRRGYTLDYFLAQFPTVKREQAEAVLEMAKERVSQEAGAGA